MISKELLNKLKKGYKSNNLNKITYKSALIDLVIDYKDILNFNFNIEIDTHSPTNQESTGRCWSFAGLNILRESVIKKCNINTFELSESYIAFYDKLERFNYFQDKLIWFHKENKNSYDKDVQEILSLGFDDGSTYSEFKELINKYGVIPKDNYSNSYNSNDTAELNEILSRLLRKFYLDLEKRNYKKLKDKYIENAYKVLCDIYDVPPERFDFEYTDKEGIYHIDRNLTPLIFYKKYIDIDLYNDYIEVYTYEDEKYKYNNVYYQEDSFINSSKRTVVLNLKYDRLEELMVKQLSNNELVYFSASTSSKYQNGLWIDLMKRYSELFNIDLNMDNNSINKTYGTFGEHSMILTGVQYDKEVKRWKIENSWGSKEGVNGYFIAEPDYMKNYIISAVINKKYLNKKEQKILLQNPILVDKWDNKFC